MWNESDHPRDNDGKFTFKDGGAGLKGRIEQTEISTTSDVSDKLSAGEILQIAFDVLGKLATPALMLYSDIDSLVKTIKENKLEDKFNIALQNTIREKEKNIKNISSVNNKNSNKEYKVNNVKYSSKIKENSINFLGSDKRKNNNIELNFKQSKKYKDILLDVLSDKATPADILYGTTKELEKKIKEYGLEDELMKISFIESAPTGFGINNTNKQNVKSNSKEYIKPTSIGRITSPYGDRVHPVKKVMKFHDGIDIGVPIGTPVGAVSNGKVIYVGKKTGYGNYVEVQYKNSNGDNITTFYAHLNDFKTKDGKILKVGQIVKQGEQIGHSGNTGIGTGAHLHLGARKNGEKINPIDIIGNVYPKK